jgi:DNA-binding FrmR family transcriptional regulator
MQYDDNLKRRLSRIEGQVRGVIRMMDSEKHCKDVVTQLTAVRNAVDKTIAHIVAANLGACIMENKSATEAELQLLVEEAVTLMVKSR